MSITAGIDIGSTHAKAIVFSREGEVLGRAVNPTGFRLAEIAEKTHGQALADAGLKPEDIEYACSKGKRNSAAGCANSPHCRRVALGTKPSPISCGR